MKQMMLTYLKKRIADSPKPITIAELQDDLLDRFYPQMDMGQYCRAKVYFSDRRILMIVEDMGYETNAKNMGCDTRRVIIYAR